MTVEFSPESWFRGADAVTEDAQAFARKAEGVLSGMTTARLNCDGYGTMMDAGFAMVFPAAVAALQETAAGLGQGFVAVSEGMSMIGDSYRRIEEQNEAAAAAEGWQ